MKAERTTFRIFEKIGIVVYNPNVFYPEGCLRVWEEVGL